MPECRLLFGGSAAYSREFRYYADEAPPNVTFSVQLSEAAGEDVPFQVSAGTSWASVSPRAGSTPRTITFSLTPKSVAQQATNGGGGGSVGASCDGDENALFCDTHVFTATSRDGCTPATVTVKLVIVRRSDVTVTSLGPTTTVPGGPTPPTSRRPRDGGLPFTGSEPSDLIVLGGAAVVLGRALLAIRNRLYGALDDREDDEEEGGAPEEAELLEP